MKSPTATIFRCLLLAQLMLAAGSLLAFDHEPLQRDAALNVDILLQQTMRHSPEFIALAARDEEARAYLEAGRRWIAGRPSLQVNYIDDRYLTDQGLMEMEYGLQLPLWRPGERHDAQRLGQQYDQELRAWRELLMLTIAGRLRTNLADLADADELVRVETQAVQDAQALLQLTEILFAAGEAAERDVMQARTALLDQQRQLLRAEAAVVDAEFEYVTLTGLRARPGVIAVEDPVEIGDIESSHPQLRFLQASIDVKQGQVEQTRLAARGNPTLILGNRRQRDFRMQNFVDSVSLSVNVPFGGRGYVDAKVSSAMRDKTESEVAYQQTRRELTLALHEVEHELFVLERELVLGREQAALERRQWDMALVAFELGEIDMTQVVLSMQRARASARQVSMLEMRQARLHGELNQIVGVLP